MEAELSHGARSLDLVPGNPEEVERLAGRLRTFATGMADAAERLGAIEAGEWKGPAGDAFRTLIGSQPKKYDEAASSFSRAASSLSQYAAILQEAQGEAQRAVDLHERAHQQTRGWEGEWERYRAETKTAVASGAPPSTPRPADTDPGAGDRARAQRLLDDARSLVNAQARTTASVLAAAEEAAPDKPGLLDSMIGGVGNVVGARLDALEAGWNAVTATLTDVGGWVADTWDDALGWLEALGPSLLEIAGGAGLVLLGGMMMTAGAGMEVVGVGLDVTGVGAVVGVPVNVGGAALVGGGFVVAVGGAAVIEHGVGGLMMASARKKDDLRQVDEAARNHGIRDRRGFGKFIEKEKKYDPGSKNERGDYTRDELDEKAEEYKEQGGK